MNVGVFFEMIEDNVYIEYVDACLLVLAKSHLGSQWLIFALVEDLQDEVKQLDA